MTEIIKDNEPTRRDFLYITTAVFGATGAATVAWPLIHQLNPDASVSALSSVEADISSIPEGGSLKVAWRGKPVFIRRRTREEIDLAEREDAESLPHPEKDAERVKNKEWLVVIGVCTHLGCIPIADKGDFGVGSAHAMVLIMIFQEELEKVQHQQTLKFRLMNL